MRSDFSLNTIPGTEVRWQEGRVSRRNQRGDGPSVTGSLSRTFNRTYLDYHLHQVAGSSSTNPTPTASQTTGWITRRQPSIWLHLSRVKSALNAPERPSHPHIPTPGFGRRRHDEIYYVQTVGMHVYQYIFTPFFDHHKQHGE